MRLLILFSVLATVVPTALSWGAAGHEIIATIAQIHLHPSTKAKLCRILPSEAKCHLAPIAAWADQVRNRYRATGPMHYVNPKLDHPAQHCEYGEHGWDNENINVLTAITNMTQQVMDGKGDIPLRFLTHFVGDLHQPLHLTGRDKGGNGAMFRFEGRQRNLHSVWDSGIITKNIRELSNYTSPLPSKQIESSLLGAIFDPYVRWIVWEGVREWWRDDLEEWLSCPADGDPYPHSSLDPSIPPSSSPLAQTFQQASILALSLLPDPILGYLQSILPLPTKDTEGFEKKLLNLTPQAVSVSGKNSTFPACPYTWSLPLHDINCNLAWPKEYTGSPGEALIELDTDRYVGRIGREKTVEKLLAMGGLRLAKVVNEALAEVYLEEGEEVVRGLYLDY